jgi:hypothetical protein
MLLTLKKKNKNKLKKNKLTNKNQKQIWLADFEI